MSSMLGLQPLKKRDHQVLSNELMEQEVLELQMNGELLPACTEAWSVDTVADKRTPSCPYVVLKHIEVDRRFLFLVRPHNFRLD